jgi:hypothetical protein
MPGMESVFRTVEAVKDPADTLRVDTGTRIRYCDLCPAPSFVFHCPQNDSNVASIPGDFESIRKQIREDHFIPFGIQIGGEVICLRIENEVDFLPLGEGEKCHDMRSRT